MLYVKARIIHTDGLQFELRTAPDAAIYLKNNKTGEILMLATKGRFHITGIQPVGSPNFECDEGAFDAEFAEDPESYYGHPIVDSVVLPERGAYPKTHWSCLLRPGDECLSLHIPRNADISVENMMRAVNSARKIISERYPEHTGVMVFGSSWILDPQLVHILGENSKIAQLVNLFQKYPQKCEGKGIFGYVFPKNYDSIESLPEDTSLQRKLKQHYLDGKFIYDYAGFIL